jgi:hypothetical protein
MKYLALTALLLGGYSSAASAQLGTGQSGHSTAVGKTNVRPFLELQAFGKCFAKTYRSQALAVIATVPGTAEEAKAFDRLVYGEDVGCLFGGTQMVMPIVFARGAIAEGLLKGGGVPDGYRLPSPAAAQVRSLHDGARCYVAGHRTEVDALLATQLGSLEENKAAAAIWPEFRTCIPGQSVRLNAPWIRFLMSEALLRVAPATSASGG